MTRINTNVSSLIAQNRLTKSNSDLQTSLTRLSTGLRINTGKDDPAGLIASEALRADITSINKAISNTQRATQIIATADSALGQVSSLLNDIRGLVVEAANSGALSDDEIAANQLQVDSSLEAINRIAQTTTFQGRKLLDGSLDFLTTAGSNFTKIKDLRINQANLGSAGNVNLDIKVTSAATRARVEVANIPAAGDVGTGTLTLNNVAANAEATGTVTGATSASAFSVTAKDGTAIDGTAGNGLVVNLAAGATAATAQATTGVQTTSDGDFIIAVKAGSQFDGAAANGGAVTVDVISGSTATAQATSAAQDVNGNTGVLTIKAKAGGAYDGTDGNAITVTIDGANGVGAGVDAAAVALNTLAITVDDARSYSLSEIKALLEADGDFSADFEIEIAEGAENVLFRTDATDDLSFALDGSGTTGSAGTDAVALVDFTNGALTITVNDNQDETLSDIQTALQADATFAANFVFNLGVDGTFADDGSDDTTGGPINVTGGANEAATATFADGILNITIDNQTDRSTAEIKAALEAVTDFNDNFTFAITNAGNFNSDGTDDVAG